MQIFLRKLVGICDKPDTACAEAIAKYKPYLAYRKQNTQIGAHYLHISPSW
ncbi:hypothetical protein [Scytonema sp. NUACC21]